MHRLPHIGPQKVYDRFMNLKGRLKIRNIGLRLLSDGKDCFATVKMGLRCLYDQKDDFISEKWI